MGTTQHSNFQTQGVLPLPGTLHGTVKIRKSMPRQDAEDWGGALMRVWRNVLVIHLLVSLLFDFVEMDALFRVMDSGAWLRVQGGGVVWECFAEAIHRLMDLKYYMGAPTRAWMVNVETFLLHGLVHMVATIFAKPNKLVSWCWDQRQGVLGVVGLDKKREVPHEGEHVWPVPVQVNIEGVDGEPVLCLTPSQIASEAKDFEPARPWPQRLSLSLVRGECALGLSVDPDDAARLCLELRDKGYGERFQVRVEASDVSPRALHGASPVKTWPVEFEVSERVKFLEVLRVVMDVQGLDGPALVDAREVTDV